MDGPLPRVRAGAPDHSLPTAAWTTAMRGCPQPLGQPRCAVAHTANSPDSSGLSLPDEDSAGRRRCRDDPTIWRRYRDDSASLPRRPEPPAEEQAQWSLVGGGKVVPCSWRLTERGAALGLALLFIAGGPLGALCRGKWPDAMMSLESEGFERARHELYRVRFSEGRSNGLWPV